MSVAQRVLKNTAFLFLAEGASRFVSALLSVAVARHLGPFELGQYSFVISILTVANVVADFGLTAFLIKHQAALDGESRKTLAAQVTFLRLVIGLSVFVLLVGYANWAISDMAVRNLLLIASLGLFAGIYSSICIAELRVREMMGYEAISRVGGAVVTTVLGLTLLALGYGIMGLLALSVLVQAMISVYYYIVARGHDLNRGLTRPSKVAMRTVVVGVTPFLTVALLSTIYFRIDSIMIEYMLGSHSLGLYAAVYKIMEMLLTIPVLLSTTLFPVLAKHLDNNPPLVLKSASQVIKLLSILALPLVGAGVVLAPLGIVALYTVDYASAVPVFQILVFTLIPVFITAVTSVIISASRRPSFNTYLAGLMVCSNIGLNLVLIPRMGISGAAYATVATEVVGMIIGLLYIHKYLGRLYILRPLFKPLLASLVMVMAIILYPSLWLIPVYGIIYFFVLRLLRPLNSEDAKVMEKVLPFSMHKYIPLLV